MEKYFRTQDGKIVNIIEHTLDQIEKFNHLEISIGTDSQDWGQDTVYVTCIAYRYGRRGAHFIYLKEVVSRIKDFSQFTRLYGEGLRTLEIHDTLTQDIPIAVKALEFDFADAKKTISSKLVSAFKGYANSTFKTGEMIACKAADHVIRHPSVYK